MRRAVIKTPAPLSSIFSPKVLDGGKPKSSPDLIGARGGGFSFLPGVDTIVEIHNISDGYEVEVNGERESFPPTEKAIEYVRKNSGFDGYVRVKHFMHVPIATGFGTSASAALSVILAITHLMGRPVTLREAIKLTHYVELECKTGLNSEAGFGLAGLVLVLREGSPENYVVDEIPIPSKTKIVAVVAGELETPEALSSTERLQQLERLGDRYIEKIIKEPTPSNFLNQAKAFALDANFADDAVVQVFKAMENLPTIGYAQNMVGRAVHALVHQEDVKEIVAALKKKFPTYRVIVGDPSSSITLNTL